MCTITSVTRFGGLAGQYGYVARLADRLPVTFYGSTYGGPIIMSAPGLGQVIVSQATRDRIGDTLNADWVRRFFA